MWTYNHPNELYHHGVLGMKWGVRKYQNKDGSLTDAGKKRYDRDVKANNARKKDNRIVIDGPDADRWVREDLTRAKKTVNSVSDLVESTKKLESSTRPSSSPKKIKMNLSNMTDQQLRDQINRANLEKQYNDLFAPESKPVISKGRKFISDTLDVSGRVLAVGSSALGLAIAIKELRG
jgi:hypothetical protein